MEQTFQFESMVKGETFPVRKTFMEAWNDMFQWVEKQLESGGFSYQVLETAIWITDGGGLPTFFYDARDRAISQYGWLYPKKKA
jgi:hypothetical protein